MKYRSKVLAVLLVAVLTAVPLAACSKKAAPVSEGDASSGGQGNASSQTRIVGKVTSVIGNQVVLAVGKLKNAGGFGGRPESSDSSGPTGRSGKSEASSQNEAASSGAQASGSSGSSSDSITLTGETQTVLIPVGLTLSYGGTTARRSSGSAGSQTGGSQAGGSGGRSFGGGSAGGTSGGSFGGFGGTSGSGTSRSGGAGASGSRSGGSAGGTPAGTAGSTLATLQRSQDFSSIKKGMVLQIAEETLSDRTQGITQVRVISQ